MAFSLTGRMGVNFAEVVAGTTTDEENALFPLGTCEYDDDGAKYVYVQASAAIAQYDAVAITEAHQATPITKALADDCDLIGVAEVAFADNELGWVKIDGPVTVNVLASCAAEAALFTSATAGKLDDASGSQTYLSGIMLKTAETAAATAAESGFITNGIHAQVNAG